eukprot:8268488-Alexandrium_andersonii.AAC.1
MSASLVGSEMCIRDRPPCVGRGCAPPFSRAGQRPCRPSRCAGARGSASVSYTHLTLPTICSV